MAGTVPSISRRRVLGTAASLPVLAAAAPLSGMASPAPTPPPSLSAAARRLWDRRLARYRRLSAETEAAGESGGWFHAANARFGRECAAAAGRADFEAVRRAAFVRVAAAEDAYWERCTDPMQKAAAALAGTPAPNLAALRAKIGAMRAVQLHELGRTGRDCLALLEEDVARLGALPVTADA